MLLRADTVHDDVRGLLCEYRAAVVFGVSSFTVIDFDQPVLKFGAMQDVLHCGMHAEGSCRVLDRHKHVWVDSQNLVYDSDDVMYSFVPLHCILMSRQIERTVAIKRSRVGAALPFPVLSDRPARE